MGDYQIKPKPEKQYILYDQDGVIVNRQIQRKNQYLKEKLHSKTVREKFLAINDPEMLPFEDFNEEITYVEAGELLVWQKRPNEECLDTTFQFKAKGFVIVPGYVVSARYMTSIGETAVRCIPVPVEGREVLEDLIRRNGFEGPVNFND